VPVVSAAAALTAYENACRSDVDAGDDADEPSTSEEIRRGDRPYRVFRRRCTRYTYGVVPAFIPVRIVDLIVWTVADPIGPKVGEPVAPITREDIERAIARLRGEKGKGWAGW
jgi:hypothetical protein